MKPAMFARTGSFHVWARALRLHQWVKNFLVFVPFALAGKEFFLKEIEHFLIGFTAFCLMSSATYIVNDLLDIKDDRTHSLKKNRPFASGQLSRVAGISCALVFTLGAVALASQISAKFGDVLASYVALTLVYSLVLKRHAIIDVLTLAILFTLRIAAGMMLVPTPPSFWLLLFSFFFFFSLALVKRYAELNDLALANGHKVAGRVYVVTDRPFIMSTGLASTFAGCLVFVIYIVNEHFPRNIYSSPQWLWGICAVLVYWMVRMWFLTMRGIMHQDPIIFALRDRASLAMGILTAIFVALAW